MRDLLHWLLVATYLWITYDYAVHIQRAERVRPLVPMLMAIALLFHAFERAVAS